MYIHFQRHRRRRLSLIMLQLEALNYGRVNIYRRAAVSRGSQDIS